MVSQDTSKESTSTFLHHCLISNMDNSPARAEDHRNDDLHFEPIRAPFYFSPLGEQICRPEDAHVVISSLINSQNHKGNHNLGVCHGNGHGLSLTLGSHLPNEFSDHRHANAVNCKHLSNDNMLCEGEISGRVYSTLKPPNQTFNEMASILSALQNSPYMKPAQQLLDEVVCVSNAVESGSDKQMRKTTETAMADGLSSCEVESTNLHERNHYSSDEKHAVNIRISKLIALLDQLESRYEHYFHQIETVVSSFEVVAGPGSAASYTALTIQAMSKHFSNLRNSIITQLNASRDSLARGIPRNHGDFSHKSSRQKRETLQQLGMMHIKQVWRPLRGLPEESVAYLRSWLFEHFLHPYPTENEKNMLASQTGLTRNQISNWFINARVRLWKPMIEEMYREEFAEDMQD